MFQSDVNCGGGGAEPRGATDGCGSLGPASSSSGWITAQPSAAAASHTLSYLVSSRPLSLRERRKSGSPDLSEVF